MKTNNPLISVIIPIFNGEKHLSKCLQSIINQTYKNLEIIIIDDGSIDNSLTICKDYSFVDNRIKIIHKSNEGVSVARNIGLSKATGEYVSFVDSDDWLELDTYKALINCIIKNKANIVFFEYFINLEDNKEICKTNKKLNGIISKSKAIEITIKPINRFSVTKLYDKQSVLNIKYDKSIYYGEDTLFACQAIDQSQSIYYLAKPLYHYVQTENSATRSMFNIKKTTSIEAYLKIVKLCEFNYIDIVDIAKSEYILMIINNISEVLSYPNYPYSKKILKDLTIRLRNNSLAILFSKVSLKFKFKFIICYLSPKVYHYIKSIYQNRK